MTVNIDLLPEELELIVRGLDHYDAYARAVQREDGRYKALLDRLTTPQRRPVVPQLRPVSRRNRRGRSTSSKSMR